MLSVVLDLRKLSVPAKRWYCEPMELTVVQSQWKGFRVDSLPVDHVLDIWPEQGYPHGREAKRLSDLWVVLRNTDIPGLLLLGCDVAADPDDYELMSKQVHFYPTRVHTGLVKLWPASTRRDEWIWSHRGGPVGRPFASQNAQVPVVYFSLGFLWVPRQLLDLAFPTHDNWKWGEMDVALSEMAFHNRIAAQVVLFCTPKHLHFTEAHNR